MMQTTNIIKILCDSYPEFKLYFETHFEIIPHNSLVPEFDEDMNPIFTKGFHIQRKDLRPEDKIVFYGKDMELWKEIQVEQREEGDSNE